MNGRILATSPHPSRRSLDALDDFVSLIVLPQLQLLDAFDPAPVIARATNAAKAKCSLLRKAGVCMIGSKAHDEGDVARSVGERRPNQDSEQRVSRNARAVCNLGTLYPS